ncbi:T9SS type A sorting domain-containing protein [Flavobacterium litorale]|uniref:T9SS type A sorting domain-containing protein n=1 Tax=Flavobacterium litorale TaxID=2856519 RepID=A0ABX8V5U4_9FLAO|nr:T9SS type A sorting domain-containing protein [Flavobacterium litorale]QYJ68197.1 T9SS type A sorting domain-containing protein [Flavobacterium litorale]
MKRLYILYIFLLLISFKTDAQWVQLPQEIPNMNSIYFIDVNIGYIGTKSIDDDLPKLFKTTNGGVNWTEIIVPETGNYTKITSIHFFDENKGFLTTDDPNTSLKTTDGGENWNVIYCGIEGAQGKAYFKNDGTGFYYTYDLTRSDDEGATWSPANFEYGGLGIHDIYFINNQGAIGYMIKDWGIFKTINNGETWTWLLATYESSGAPSIFFVDEEVGYHSGGGGIYKTVNGGETWQNTYVLGGTELYFINENIGFVISRNFMQNHPNDTILKTLDGGDNWQAMHTVDNPGNIEYIIDFNFPDSTTGYAIASDGYIYKLDVAAGIEDITNNTVAIYPIPAKNVLNINNVEELQNSKYQIVDFTGKTIIEGTITDRTINISKLAKGVYLLQIDNRKAIKFIKE